MKNFFVFCSLILCFWQKSIAQETVLFSNITYIPATDTTWVFVPKDYATTGDKK